MEKTMSARAVIYSKDVEKIIGKSEKTARRLLLKVRKQTGKTNDQFVTVEEFCQVTGIPKSVVLPYIV
jgi:hypothetical protein